MISFTSNLIKDTMFRSLTDDGKLVRKTVKLLEMSPKNSEDVRTINELTKHWACEDTLLLPLKDNFDFSGRLESDVFNRKYFILTDQRDLTQKLDVKRILGVAETSYTDINKVEIDYFQTKPKQLQTLHRSNMDNLGFRFLNLLKNYYDKSTIWLYSMKSTENFYMKNGFEKIKETLEGLSILRYRRRKIK